MFDNYIDDESNAELEERSDSEPDVELDDESDEGSEESNDCVN